MRRFTRSRIYLLGKIDLSITIRHSYVKMYLIAFVRRKQEERFDENVRLVNGIPIVVDRENDVKSILWKVGQRGDFLRQMLAE